MLALLVIKKLRISEPVRVLAVYLPYGFSVKNVFITSYSWNRSYF